MKTIHSTFVSLILLTSCTEKPIPEAGKQQFIKSDSSMVIARRFVEAYNDHNLTALRNLYSRDATIASVDFEGSRQVDSAIQKTYREYFAGSPDLKAVVRKIIVDGNNIAIAFACQGTIRNIDKGDPALRKSKRESMKNKTLNIEVVSLFQVKNGKITEEKTVYNQLTFLKQIGVMK